MTWIFIPHSIRSIFGIQLQTLPPTLFCQVHHWKINVWGKIIFLPWTRSLTCPYSVFTVWELARGCFGSQPLICIGEGNVLGRIILSMSLHSSCHSITLINARDSHQSRRMMDSSDHCWESFCITASKCWIQMKPTKLQVTTCSNATDLLFRSQEQKYYKEPGN